MAIMLEIAFVFGIGLKAFTTGNVIPNIEIELSN